MSSETPSAAANPESGSKTETGACEAERRLGPEEYIRDGDFRKVNTVGGGTSHERLKLSYVGLRADVVGFPVFRPPAVRVLRSDKFGAEDVLRRELDGLRITSENIGEIRARYLIAEDEEWNALVRDETAAREGKAPVRPAVSTGRGILTGTNIPSVWKPTPDGTICPDCQTQVIGEACKCGIRGPVRGQEVAPPLTLNPNLCRCGNLAEFEGLGWMEGHYFCASCLPLTMRVGHEVARIGGKLSAEAKGFVPISPTGPIPEHEHVSGSFTITDGKTVWAPEGGPVQEFDTAPPGKTSPALSLWFKDKLLEETAKDLAAAGHRLARCRVCGGLLYEKSGVFIHVGSPKDGHVGVPTEIFDPAPVNTAGVFTRPRVGFFEALGNRLFPSEFPKLPEVEWAPPNAAPKGDVIHMTGVTEFSVLDRLRLIVSGRLVTRAMIVCENEAGRTKSVMTVRPLAPGKGDL